MANESNFKLFIIILLLVNCFSCKSQKKQLTNNDLSLRTTYYDDGKTLIKEQYFLNTANLRDSLYVLFDTNGDTIRKGYYKDSRKNGLWEEPNHKNLPTQGSRLYQYYTDDKLNKTIEKVWIDKTLKTNISEKSTLYKDRVEETLKTWDKEGKYIHTYAQTTYFDPENLTQKNASILKKHWYYNTEIIRGEDFVKNTKFQWRKFYSPKGKLYKHFKYNDKGKLQALSIYDENEQVKTNYSISKVEEALDTDKMIITYKYYDQNNKRLPSELFELVYP